MGKFLKKLLSTIDGFITFLSPIAAIFYVLGAVLLFVELTEHPNRIRTLADEGELALAVVDYIDADGDVQVTFEDSQNRVRYANIEKKMYTADTLASLTIDSTHLVRYDPHFRYDPALEDHWSEFESYRNRIDGLIFILGLSFVILVIRPDILFINYEPDFTALYHRKFTTTVGEEQP